jgi:DNA-binding transcriptional LysR family regulator
VNYGNLILFKEIAAHRSISKASQSYGVGQSAASQQLQDLERELGTPLVNRSKRPLLLTPAGELFAEFCRSALRQKEEFESALAGLKQEVGGTVRVASIYSIGLSEMAQLEKEFRRRLPHATLEVDYLRPDRVREAVLTGAADLGLMSYAESTRELTSIPWRKEEMVLASAPDHALAKKAASLSEPLPVSELQGVDFVAFDDDLPIRSAVDRFLKERGIEVQEAAHFDNVEMIKEAVALRVGVSILPARVFREDVRQRRLAAIRLAGSDLYRPLCIIHQKKRKFSGAGLALLDLLSAKPNPESV